MSLDRHLSLGFSFHPIRSIPSADFAQAIAQGKPLYNIETLIQYVENDLELLDNVKPDLVVGDFRLSLAVSAPLRRIPYAAVVNAYWSPYADIDYPVPDLPMTRFLGVRLAQKLFNIIRPVAFAMHARPLNRVRCYYGLSPLGSDLRNIYTWGDYTLYADLPELVPTRPLPANHRYLGPPLWSVHAPLPDWWHYLSDNKPVILMIMGSSGHAELLPIALSALSELPITVIAATAGKIELPNVPANAFVVDYLPLDLVARRASLIICNGGSLTTCQAIASGVPILGICSNMDQLLNMIAIERLGAGLCLRAASIKPAQLKEAVLTVLKTPTYARAAEQARKQFRQVDTGQRFRAFISEVLG